MKRLLIDAHCHLQDEALESLEGVQFYDDLPIGCSLVNGTSPADWGRVEALVSRLPFVKAAYGVHPWKVEHLPEDWETDLINHLKAGAISVGEIGIDSWIEPRNEDLQDFICSRQLEIAELLSLPPTLHVLRAWDRFEILLKRKTGLKNGFLVHGFSGSLDILKKIVDAGGYVSFSAYAGDVKRKRMREAIQQVPVDRILIETDAPDMLPPADWRITELQNNHGVSINHPANLLKGYQLVADIKGVVFDFLVDQVSKNAERLFNLSQK